MGDYDFIIAGGGTAGCILANRLSADGKHRVLMLEAGFEARSMWISIPAGFSKLLVNPDYNWRFATEPEDNVHGRTIAVPRGKAGDLKPVAQRTDPLIAPLAKGQQVGTLQFTLDGKVLRTEPLVVQDAVERAGFFGRMVDTVKRWFQ